MVRAKGVSAGYGIVALALVSKSENARATKVSPLQGFTSLCFT